MDVSSNAVANIIAGFSLIISILIGVLYYRERHFNRLAFANEYHKQILEWYAKTIRILMELKLKVCKDPATNTTALLAKLSAQIEIGRFYFPNVDKNDGYGSENSTAYQGYRNLALDFLVASYKLYSGPEPEKKLEYAKHLHKYFTSVIFEVVLPKEHLAQIKKITDRYFMQEKVSDDFLLNPNASHLHDFWRANV